VLRAMFRVTFSLQRRFADVPQSLNHRNVMASDFGDWIHLAQNSDQWCVLVNTVMNLWIPYKVGIP